MKITELDYPLPSELIAKQPLSKRDMARLLVLHRKTGNIEHKQFFQIIDYLEPGDLVIINNTKVIPARLIAKKPTGGKLEILLIREKQSSENATVWEVMTRGSYRGELFIDEVSAIIENNSNGRILTFKMNSQQVRELIDKKGFMPLPPYIKRKPVESDRVNYQTVFAKYNGSIAAPTAGLHFTRELLNKIEDKGVLIKELTLHVGVGTFKPLKVNNVQEHKMDPEYFEIPRQLIEEINNTKKKGKKVVATGTTTTRAIEGYASEQYTDMGSNKEIIRGSTDIFIYPGYKFKIVDALITNFHLPRSTPLALVCAFAGIDMIKKAYKEAIEQKYRFFSYGDAMLIL